MLHSGAAETKQIQDVEIRNRRQDSRPKQIGMEPKPGGAHGTEEKHNAESSTWRSTKKNRRKTSLWMTSANGPHERIH
jgi:hypothetical protein